MLRVTCACGKSLTTDEKNAGRKAKCPKCGGDVTFPDVIPESLRTIRLGDEDAVEAENSTLPVHPDRRIKLPINKPMGLFFGGVAAIILAVIAAYGAMKSLRNDVGVIEKPFDRSGTQAVSSGIPVRPSRDSHPALQSENSESERFRALLKRADKVFSEDEEHIRKSVDQLLAAAKKTGLSLTPEQAIEGSLRWAMPGYYSRVKDPKFAEYAHLYMIHNVKFKGSHDEMIRQLHVLASALHVVTEGVSEDLFNAEYAKASPGCQLAMAESFDVIRPDDPIAEYYQYLAEQVGTLYGQPTNLIGASVSYLVTQLKLAKESGRPAEILNAAAEWPPLLESKQSGERAPNFGEFLMEYYSLKTGKTLTLDDTK